MLLLPHMSVDYKLIHIFIPLSLYINFAKKNSYDWFYLLMFSLLLIPKDYFLFSKSISDTGYKDISISIMINPILMVLMVFAFMRERLAEIYFKKEVIYRMLFFNSAFSLIGIFLFVKLINNFFVGWLLNGNSMLNNLSSWAALITIDSKPFELCAYILSIFFILFVFTFIILFLKYSMTKCDCQIFNSVPNIKFYFCFGIFLSCVYNLLLFLFMGFILRADYLVIFRDFTSQSTIFLFLIWIILFSIPLIYFRIFSNRCSNILSK